VAPAAVIEPPVARQPAVPLLRGLEGHGLGPFCQQGLEEPLGLAVRPAGVGLDADELEIQGSTGFSSFSRVIGGAVV
jgi:hypothetical protein